MKKILVLLMVMVVLLCGCGKKDDSDIEYYDEYDIAAEEQQEEQEEAALNEGTTENRFDFDSYIKYDINSEIQKLLLPEKFDKEFIAFLEESGFLEVKAINVITAKDTGFLAHYFDGYYEFELELQTDTKDIIICTVEGDNYEFRTAY